MKRYSKWSVIGGLESEEGGVHSVTYRWDGVGSYGANMSAEFRDDKLVSKLQYGLQ